MTTATAQEAASLTQVRRTASSGSHLTFWNLVRSQWIALSSLRGSIFALIFGIVATAGLATAFTVMISLSHEWSGGETVLPDLTAMGMNTVTIAICVAVVVAVSHYAKEHTTGAHRTVLAAAPRRGSLIGAKAVVIGASTFVGSVVALAVSFAGASIVYGAFGNTQLSGSFLDGVVLPIVGGAFYATACAVFALAVSVLLRSETWSILLVLIYLLMLPTVLMMLPFEWAPTVADYLLSTSGESLTAAFTGIDSALLTDLALTIAWPAATLALAIGVERSRDA